MTLFTTKNTVPAIFGVMREALETRKRLVGLIAAARADEQRAAAASSIAETSLATDEADLAIAGTAGPSQSSRQMIDANVRLEAIDARIRGLNAKLDENAGALIRQESELLAARKEWNRARIAELTPEYVKIVAAVAAVNRKMLALGEALEDQTAIGAAQGAAAFSPETGKFILEDTLALGLQPDFSHSGFIDPDWEKDPKALAIFEANNEPAVVGKKFAATMDAVRLEMRERKNAADAAKYKLGLAKVQDRIEAGVIQPWQQGQEEPRRGGLPSGYTVDGVKRPESGKEVAAA